MNAKTGIRSLVLLGLVLVLCGTAYVYHYHRHLDIPKGIDQPGYLHMAEAMHQGNTFGDPVVRPFYADLITHLEQEGYPVEEYMFFIGPMAYHIQPQTGQLINQYPPGTSFVISWLPKQDRAVFFPALVVLILLFFPLLALWKVNGYHWKPFFRGAQWLVVLVLLFLVIRPLNIEFTRISSVGLTYGLLLAAGILLRKHPLWSMACLGVACTFRIAHIVLLAPIGLHYIWITIVQPGLATKPLVWLKQGGWAVGVFMAGFVGYFVYTYQLMGNPFLSTYAGLDTQFSEQTGFLDNVVYYFTPGRNWFVVHLVVMGLLVFITRVGLISKRWLLFLSCTAVFNYLFYFTHQIAVSYYPHASAVLLMGALLEGLKEYNPMGKAFRLKYIALPAVVMVLLWQGFGRDDFGSHRTAFAQQVQDYHTCFDAYDVVWGQYHSGSLEYATGKPTFSLLWASPALRTAAIRWLAANGYRQAIWLNDLDMTNKKLEKGLDQQDISYEKTTCTAHGDLYIIHPQEHP